MPGNDCRNHLGIDTKTRFFLQAGPNLRMVYHNAIVHHDNPVAHHWLVVFCSVGNKPTMTEHESASADGKCTKEFCQALVRTKDKTLPLIDLHKTAAVFAPSF